MNIRKFFKNLPIFLIGAPLFAHAAITIDNIDAPARQITFDLTATEDSLVYYTLFWEPWKTCGNISQIRNGQDSGGQTAYRYGSLWLDPNVTVPHTIRGTRQESRYTLCLTDGFLVTQQQFVADQDTDYPLTSVWTEIGDAAALGDSTAFSSLDFTTPGTPYLGYTVIAANGQTQQKVALFDGSDWEVQGVNPPEGSRGASILSPDGVLYTATLTVSGNATLIRVWKLDGQQWIPVSHTITPGYQPESVRLAFSTDGMPCVFYIAGNQGFDGNGKAIGVIRLDGNMWREASIRYIGSGAYAVEVNGNGTLYLAAYDNYNAKITISKFSNHSWDFVTEHHPFWRNPDKIDIAFSGEDGIYISEYSEYYSAVSVKGFNGNYLPYIYLPTATPVHFAVCPEGRVYLSYTTEDAATGQYMLNVQRHDPRSGWSQIGGGIASHTPINRAPLFMAPDGTPYLAYEYQSGNSTGLSVLRLRAR